MTTEKKTAPLRSNQLHVARHAFTSFCVNPEIGVKLDDVLHVDFLQHVAPKLNAGDTIYVSPEGLEYWAHLLVVSVSGKEVVTRIITQVDLSGGTQSAQVDDYVVNHGGPQKWRVMKGKDVVSKGHDSKEVAEKALAKHLEETDR